MIRLETDGRSLAGGVSFGEVQFFGGFDSSGGKRRYNAGFGWRF
ncbi:MAG: hypothetical protein V1794_16240 [Candidatus Glassbacteria bacterium]